MRQRSFCRLQLRVGIIFTVITLATTASDEATIANDDAPRHKRPQRSARCKGVWTKFWADTEELEDVKRQVETPMRALLDRHECPFGKALPGDVTWPSPSDELQGLVAPLDTLKIVAVAYGYVPYVLGGQAVWSFFVHRGTRQLGVLLWLLFMLSVNELILKKAWRQSRPGAMLQVRDFTGMYAGSCLHSCGMPSSHSALAVGWFTLLFLDAVYRAYPFALGGKTHTIATPTAGACEKATKCLRMYLWVPWADADVLTHTQFVVFISAWFLLLCPVPFMRVVLYDHTFEQVTVGACVGFVVAVIWWRVVRHFQRKYHDQEGQRVFHGKFVHNHRIAKFHLSCAGNIDSIAPSP